MLIEELKKFAELIKGNALQERFYQRMINDAEVVEMTKISSVFSPKEIEMIRACVQPKQGEYYKNAILLANLFPERVKYVEGKFLVGGIIGIEHAWNKVDDKYYVDITSEMVLKKDPTAEGEEYMKLYEECAEVVVDFTLKDKNGMCGGIYNDLLIKEFKSAKLI